MQRMKCFSGVFENAFGQVIPHWRTCHDNIVQLFSFTLSLSTVVCRMVRHRQIHPVFVRVCVHVFTCKHINFLVCRITPRNIDARTQTHAHTNVRMHKCMQHARTSTCMYNGLLPK